MDYVKLNPKAEVAYGMSPDRGSDAVSVSQMAKNLGHTGRKSDNY